MSTVQGMNGKKLEDVVFSDQRFGDRTGFIYISDLEVGKSYETQYGETMVLSEPYEDYNPISSEMSMFVNVRIMDGRMARYMAIDLVWIGMIPNQDGLWRQNAYCYEFLHNLHGELID